MFHNCTFYFIFKFSFKLSQYIPLVFMQANNRGNYQQFLNSRQRHEFVDPVAGSVTRYLLYNIRFKTRVFSKARDR